MSNKYSIGALNELAEALESAGFTSEDLLKLVQYNGLVDIKNVINGYAQLKVIEHIIDCNTLPSLPRDSGIKEHKKGGYLSWNPSKIHLFQREEQKHVYGMSGEELHQELAGKPVLNANVLDYLLAHQELIPKEWKRIRILFWGTIFFDKDSQSVPYLYWHDAVNKWDKDRRWIVKRFDNPRIDDWYYSALLVK